MMVVVSRHGGQVMFFLLHISLAIFHTSSLWFASQLNRMCCIDSVVSHFAEASVVEISHFGPVRAALMCAVEEFPQEVSYVCGYISSVHKGGSPYAFVAWFFDLKVEDCGMHEVEV